MKLKLFSILFLLVALAVPTQSFAGSNRESHKFGIYGTLLGEPFPSVWGLNLGYNISSLVRLSGGYGSISATTIGVGLTSVTTTITTYGANLKFMLMPDSNFTPVLGAGWAQIQIAFSGGTGTSLSGFSASGSHFYGTAAMDWTASNGFFFEGGYNFSFTSGVGGAPFIGLGLFF